uniref:Uncharacterized protein n=1 Tax=Fundulus heteroclitus TaxID=8078 RepID=A0A3Q2P2I5_FUNHE
MDRVTVANCCLGLLGLLLLQGVVSVEGRSIFTSGKCAKIFGKSCISLWRLTKTSQACYDCLICFLGKWDFHLLLWEDLELERKISANVAEGKSITKKRGEPCFWKYCV